MSATAVNAGVDRSERTANFRSESMAPPSRHPLALGATEDRLLDAARRPDVGYQRRSEREVSTRQCSVPPSPALTHWGSTGEPPGSAAAHPSSCRRASPSSRTGTYAHCGLEAAHVVSPC